MQKYIDLFYQYYLPIYLDLEKADKELSKELAIVKNKTERTVLELVQMIIHELRFNPKNYSQTYGHLKSDLKKEKLDLLSGYLLLFNRTLLSLDEKISIGLDALKIGNRLGNLDLIYNAHLWLSVNYFLKNLRDKSGFHLQSIDDNKCIGNKYLEGILVQKYMRSMRLSYLAIRNEEAAEYEAKADVLIKKNKFSFHITLPYYANKCDLHAITNRSDGLIHLSELISILLRKPFYSGLKVNTVHYFSNSISNYLANNKVSEKDRIYWSQEHIRALEILETLQLDPLHINTQFLQRATLCFNIENFKDAIRYMAKAYRFFSTYHDTTNYLYLHFLAAKTYNSLAINLDTAIWAKKASMHWKKALDISQLQKVNQLKEQVEILTKQHELEKEKIKTSELKKELKMSTLHLQEKIKVLDELKTYVHSLKKTDYQMGKLIMTISNKIESIKVSDEERSVLLHKIDNSDVDFSRKMTEKYPSLSALEIRMCSLFKTGMNNKELSKLFGLSDRSYEQHRYRIKKKMNLTADDGLVEHLNNL
jgi:DNA-binding CsgD family transcriptional regulator